MTWVQKDRLRSTPNINSGTVKRPSVESTHNIFPSLLESFQNKEHVKINKLSNGVSRDPLVDKFVDELIVHAFLPRKTPDSLQRNLEDVEQCMLHLAQSTLRTLNLPEMGPVERMLENWKRIQVQPSTISSQFLINFQNTIQNLQMGESAVIYVRKQNCSLLFTKLEESMMRCVTFRPSLPNETIMSTIGSLQVAYPETDDVTLNQDFLRSTTFASQLFELCTKQFEMAMPKRTKDRTEYVDTRDIAEPFLVCDWLVGQLVPGNHPSPKKKVVVKKKIRDEVRCHPSASSLPFRRSPIWTSIKIALAMKIREIVKSDENANLLYKVIMLRMLADLGVHYSKQRSLRFDLVSQILAKLGRRAGKLQKLKVDTSQTTSSQTLDKSISSIKTMTLQYVLQISTELRDRVTKEWHHTYKPSHESSLIVKPIPRSPEAIREDIQHDIPYLDRLIRHGAFVMPSLDSNSINVDNMQLVKLKRYVTFQSSLQATFGLTSDFEQKVWLHDTELLIKSSLHLIQNDTGELMKVFYEYLSKASAFYKAQSDPVGFSQMLLCILKLVQALDRNATKEHPLLLEYRSGIDEGDFDMLLLPQKEDMDLLEEILAYFRSGDRRATYPHTLATPSISSDTFCVRYAQNNPSMVQLRASILEETEQRIQQKHEEVERAKLVCQELEKQISFEGSCSCEWELDDYGHRSYKISTCKYCSLQSSLESVKQSVSIYERRLPENQLLQHAVVFELLVPQELSSLRDALALLNFDILAKSGLNGGQSSRKWEDYMSRYPPGHGSNLVKLWSSAQPASQTYLRRAANPDVRYSSKESFIVYNGMNCFYSHNPSGVTFTRANAKYSCTYQIANTCSSNMELYKNLQYTLANTNHSQNKVIASSYSCHRDLTVAEFISFGSLRSGHRIQMRNLFRSISNRTLSLDKEPVVALILQTLWQLGPKDEDGVRDSHADFLENDAFTTEFLVLLENVVENNEQNYSSPNILLVVIVATTRVMELSEKCRQDGYTLLRKCRQILHTWAEKIEKYISEALIKSASDNLSSLKMLLLQTTICSAFTYKISSTLLDSVAQQQDDVLHWIHTIARMHELISQNMTLSTFTKSLLMIARSVPFQLETCSQFSDTSNVSHCLHLFATQNWNKANDCIILESQEKRRDYPNVFFGNYQEKSSRTEHVLTFDILQGQFLVDGYPSSSLPKQITDQKLYQLYFSGIKFKTQRDSQTFRTVDQFHGHHYEFRMTKSISKIGTSLKLIIREIDSTQNALQLIRPSNFKEIVAPSFIEKYTHWLDAKKEVVYFKRRPTEDSHYDLPPDFTLVKVHSKWHFKDMKTGKYLLSINSNGFNQIATALSRLEGRLAINVVFDEKTDQVSALLPRYQLSFHLNPEGRLCSVEYPDYKIAQFQLRSTLVGLQQGILLEHVITSKEGTTITRKIALIPHGQVEVAPGSPHQTTQIHLSTLRSPTFFAYEVDSILNRLVGGKSKAAWLYLAALHAATSSPLPDPLTGLTGTEMSMWILQSAVVWSGSPYDDESLQTLKTIRAFSPERSYYGINPTRLDIEVLNWPQGLNELAAFDGFAMIVDRLLKSSNQLSFLFPPSRSPKEAKVGNARLLTRSYLRSLPFYNPSVSVKEDYMPGSYKSEIGATSGPTCFQLRQRNSCKQLEFISQIRFVNKSIIHPTTLECLRQCQLFSYLITDEPLQPPVEIKTMLGFSVEDIFEIDMRAEWLRLYEYARSGKMKRSKEEYLAWSAYLSAMAYIGKHPQQQIVALHLISLFEDIIPFPGAPECTTTPSSYTKRLCEYSMPSANDYSRGEIMSILNSHRIQFRDRRKKVRINPATGYWEDEDRNDYNREKRVYNLTQEMDFQAIVSGVGGQWPCAKVSEGYSFSGSSSNCNYSTALVLTNQKLNMWHNNYKLKLFVEQVELLLKSDLYELVQSKLEEPSQMSLTKFGVLEGKMSRISIVIDKSKALEVTDILKSLPSGELLRKAKGIFQSGRLQVSGQLVILARMNIIWETLKGQLTETKEKEMAHVAGIAPRIVPLFLAQLLTNEEIQRNELIYNYVGALVLLFVNLKKARRCIRFKSNEDAFATELKRELENVGHENWSPAENPEWLLLELELDLMIRPVQVEVARQMMRMPNGGNGVMQLNMGEGKTSVIVPMLCATLSNEKTLCRVTVLNSIFKTNFNVLAFAIGGLLNRRLSTVPCRRDMSLTIESVSKVEKFYQESLRMRGVILTLPEYRLSFRLKIFDNIIKKGEHESLGLEMLKVENWLRSHARDILDESDELLSVKYQLVYTIGTQVPVDGGTLRWTTCQDLLRIIQLIAANVSIKHGSSVIEFDQKTRTDHPEQFAHFRILKDSCHQELCNAVADIVLGENMLPESLRQIARRFLTEESFPRELHNELMSAFGDTPDLLTKILIYSAYTRRGVLTLALTKRWRVEFGVDPRGLRRMAVPFRAKDVAAERTEFGHPDLAIILTHLSYYYSGLSDPQLMECFDCLERKIDPEITYRSWIHPIASNVPKFLQNYKGLNINDLVQRSQVFEVLRKHKAVIDFWLSHKVFPKESKQFPGKVVMTAWDLCYEGNTHPTTGFSGTNDSSVLLPLTISQQDLPQLLLTNENLEKVLLQPENRNLKGLRMGVSCREILEDMTRDNLKVLIDAGALMLDCDNEQVAQLWLEVDPGIEAAVYFNKGNEIMVKSRVESGNTKGPRRHQQEDIPLELSPYGGRLGKCGVFLDDHHTRATDLKFPVGSKACVTVGARMRRDKLMQASMRMRKLGQGHSVTFYLSHEAYDKVTEQKRKTVPKWIRLERDVEFEKIKMKYKVTKNSEPKKKLKEDDQPTSEDVINWVTSNTKHFNDDGLPYWAVAGKNYVQKLSAEHLFSLQKHQEGAASILASQCEDGEVTKVVDMYGIYTKNELLVKLIPLWFAQTKQKLQKHNGKIPVPSRIRLKVDSICSSVVKRCADNAADKMHMACLVDEEQEKELEKEAELEEEPEKILPNEADEVPPSLHPNVVKIICGGGQISIEPGIGKLSDIFRGTSFRTETQPDCWGNQVFATEDFISVIKIYSSRFETDSHLRPVEYLTIHKSRESGEEQVVLLSSFEANELMPDFRKGRTHLRLHMYNPRTFEKQDVLLNNNQLQLPVASGSSEAISEGSKQMAALSLASGNLYFDSMEEQKAFARFLGLAPQPWKEGGIESVSFDMGFITKTGFLLPKYRAALWEHCQVDSSTFLCDPASLVKKILASRHAVVGEVAHVMKLLDKHLYVEL